MSTDPNPFQVMPPLTPEEHDTLRDDIAANGVLVPVVRDQHGRTIDGHHRAQIADELGVKYRVDMVQITDDDHARTLARRYNLARRHLSRAQKRELIAAEIQSDPDRSDREIGRNMGCDHKTVGSVRRELAGEIPHPQQEMTRAEAEALQRLESVRTNLGQFDAELMELVRNGISPALAADQIRAARTDFRARFAHQFGDDFSVVDETLFCSRLDFLAGVHAIWQGFKFEADQASRIWLSAWAEMRPVEHEREVARWREAGAL